MYLLNYLVFHEMKFHWCGDVSLVVYLASLYSPDYVDAYSVVPYSDARFVWVMILMVSVNFSTEFREFHAVLDNPSPCHQYYNIHIRSQWTRCYRKTKVKNYLKKIVFISSIHGFSYLNWNPPRTWINTMVNICVKFSSYTIAIYNFVMLFVPVRLWFRNVMPCAMWR